MNELKQTLTQEIMKLYRSIFKSKMQISQFFGKLERIKECEYVFVKQFKYQIYSEPILKYISQHQNCAYQILLNAPENSDSIKELSSLIINLFPRNIYSINSLNDEFLIILTRCLLNEINKLQSKNDIQNFLINRNGAYYLLDTLYTREDIIEYFKQILHFPLTYIDYNERGNSFVFDLTNLDKRLKKLINKRLEEKELQKKKSLNEKKKTKESTLSLDKSQSFYEDNSDSSLEISYFENYYSVTDGYDSEDLSIITLPQFVKEYIPDIQQSEFDRLLSEEKDPAIKEYLEMRQEKHFQNASAYSNNNILSIMFTHENPNKIFEVYARHFCIVLRLIEEIIGQLEQNIDKIPTIIRYLCKIIEISLKKKFPDIKEYELIPYLGDVLFDKIMCPIFCMPHYFGLIDSIRLLQETSFNIKIIYKIMQKFYRCELFETSSDCNLTFFNLFFIKKMNIFIRFFRKILTTTKLPSIIEKFIDPSKYNFDPNTYVYNCFKENPKTKQIEKCCLYSPNQIVQLLNVIEGKENIIFGGEEKKILVISKGIEMLNRNKHDLNNIIQENQKKNIQEFKVFYTREVDPLYEQMEGFLENKIHSKPTCEKEEVILKAKESFCSCLNDIIDLSQCSAMKTELLNTEELITMLERISSLSSNNLCNSTFLKWESHSLKQHLQKLPIDYKVNDYSLFYSELTNELHNSMKLIHTYFEMMANYRENIRYLKKTLIDTEEILLSFRKETIANEVNDFVENANVCVEMGFKTLFGKVTKFEIKEKVDQKKSKMVVCSNIRDFYESFPNMNDKISYGKNMFNKMKELKIGQAFETYFKLISQILREEYYERGFDRFERYIKKDKQLQPQTIKSTAKDLSFMSEDDDDKINLPSKELIKEKLMSVLLQNVTNNIMEHMYFKLFPKLPSEEDIDFYESCLGLVNKTITDIDKHAVYDCSDCMFSAVECVNRFEKAYSPNEKGLQLSNLVGLIRNKIQYLKGGIIAPDDYLPYIWFVIIKAKPRNFISNMNYLKYFAGEHFEFAHSTVNTIVSKIGDFIMEDLRKTACTEYKLVNVENNRQNNNKSNNQKGFEVNPQKLTSYKV